MKKREKKPKARKKPPMPPEEALARIKEHAKAGRIAYASTDQVERYEAEAWEVLDVIGIRRAWFSDLSGVGEFLSVKGEAERPAVLEQLSNKFGFHIQGKDRLWKVAQRIRASRRRRSKG